MKVENCVCGAAAYIGRGKGMCGEDGWQISAACGNGLFGTGTAARMAGSWRRYGRFSGCPEATIKGATVKAGTPRGSR